jgi:hypothetical protein
VLVIVATLEALTAVTGSTITNISYIEPLNNSEVRAFDSQTNSLLKIDLDYAAFPISIE